MGSSSVTELARDLRPREGRRAGHGLAGSEELHEVLAIRGSRSGPALATAGATRRCRAPSPPCSDKWRSSLPPSPSTRAWTTPAGARRCAVGPQAHPHAASRTAKTGAMQAEGRGTFGLRCGGRRHRSRASILPLSSKLASVRVFASRPRACAPSDDGSLSVEPRYASSADGSNHVGKRAWLACRGAIQAGAGASMATVPGEAWGRQYRCPAPSRSRLLPSCRRCHQLRACEATAQRASGSGRTAALVAAGGRVAVRPAAPQDPRR